MLQNFKKFQKTSGFTLIELLVVAGIISIIVGTGVASYNSFNESQNVQQAAREVLTNLRRVQSNAVSGIKDNSLCGTTLLDGWCVVDNSYYGVCGSNTFPTPRPKLLSQDWLDKGISILPGNNFCFMPVYGNKNPSSTANITVENGSGLQKQIQVTSEGVVRLVE